ncbi:MAG TPA: tetratricopeptide repeat protein [Rhizomicrobium sp.]|nr:tetratricopeptide repeat protein [Rhizomicrobium sp.]
MRSSFVRSALAAAFVAGAALSMSTGAIAADKGPSVSNALKKPLSAAEASLKANDFAGALTHAKEAQAAGGTTDFDNYVINEFLGNAYIGLKDYKNAEPAFVAMANSPALPATDKVGVYSTAIQLAVNISDWPTAVKLGDQLQAAGPLPANLIEMLAIAYYNGGDKAKALTLAKMQIEADKAAGKQSSEAMMDIQMNALSTAKDNAGAMATLEGLIQQYGRPDDWARVIDFTLPNGLSYPQALNLYRLRLVTNATTSSEDYGIMADVASTMQHLPVEAEAILESGVSKGIVKPGDKASALLAKIRPKASSDRATLGEFEKQAAAHKTGDYDATLAETYYGYGRYADAEAAIRRAMGKGGLKDNAEAQMMLGMTLAQQGKNADAAAAFAKVSGNANEMKVAHLWTLYATRTYGAAPTHS